MRISRTVVLSVSAAVVVALAGGAAYLRLGPSALGPEVSRIESGFYAARVGRPVNVGFTGYYAHGRETVRVRDVRVTGLPAGLRVVSIRAHRTGPAMVGGLEGDLERDRPGVYNFRPVTEATFTPGESDEKWYFVVTLMPTRAGNWKTTGLAVDWSTRWRKGTTHYEYIVDVTVPVP